MENEPIAKERRGGWKGGLRPYRFLLKITIPDGDVNACWEWQAGLSIDGYGKTGWNQPAHRYAYELFKGPIEEGKFVCHTCDNRKCVNPKHLWVGTHEDNMRDRDAKGRSKIGYSHSAISAEAAFELKRRYDAGEETAGLAKEFGISTGYAYNIRHRLTWHFRDDAETVAQRIAQRDEPRNVRRRAKWAAAKMLKDGH